MAIKYLKDSDLEFLEFCTENDLKILARYLTHDKDGSTRYAGELLNENRFKSSAQKSDQYRRCWDLIAGELQLFGGDAFMNMARGHGVPYKEILTDVCEKLDVKFDKDASAYEIENDLLGKLVIDAWQKMTPAERNMLLKDAGLPSAKSGASGLHALLAALAAGGLVSYQVSALMSASVASVFGAEVLGLLGFNVAARSLAVLTGPIGMLILAILSLPLISGAAYRVTTPSVIHIAYMRRHYEAQDHF